MAAEGRAGARSGLLNQVCTSAALDAALDEMDKEYELQRRHLNYSFDDASSSDIDSFVSALDVCSQHFCFYAGRHGKTLGCNQLWVKKRCFHTLAHNFVRCWLILKIIYLSDWAVSFPLKSSSDSPSHRKKFLLDHLVKYLVPFSLVVANGRFLHRPVFTSLYFCRLSVCLLATLHNFQTDLHEIFREGWQWASEQMIKFWWWSWTNSPDGGTDIVTLVRHALAEVCTVLVLLVVYA